LIHALGPVSGGSIEKDEFNEAVCRLEGTLDQMPATPPIPESIGGLP
jgi:hypothetical protein